MMVGGVVWPSAVKFLQAKLAVDHPVGKRHDEEISCSRAKEIEVRREHCRSCLQNSNLNETFWA